MQFTKEQIAGILTDSCWHTGLQYYDFLLALTFRDDGSGTREYGEAQSLRSTVQFRYQLVDNTHMRFELTNLVYGDEDDDEVEIIDEAEAVHTVAFELIEESFTVEEPYTPRTYRYRLRFESDAFPDTPPDEKDSFLTYYA